MINYTATLSTGYNVHKLFHIIVYPFIKHIHLRINGYIYDIGGGSFYEVGGLATDNQLLMHA